MLCINCTSIKKLKPPFSDMGLQNGTDILINSLSVSKIRTELPNDPTILLHAAKRNDAEAETPILWPTDAKNWLNGKDPDAGKDWRQEGKGMTEGKTVGCHHGLDGHEFEQAPGVGDG